MPGSFHCVTATSCRVRRERTTAKKRGAGDLSGGWPHYHPADDAKVIVGDLPRDVVNPHRLQSESIHEVDNPPSGFVPRDSFLACLSGDLVQGAADRRAALDGERVCRALSAFGENYRRVAQQFECEALRRADRVLCGPRVGSVVVLLDDRRCGHGPRTFEVDLVDISWLAALRVDAAQHLEIGVENCPLVPM